LWSSLGRHFRDPRLRQLFARYATYCGSSPWQAPATLMLITQVELDGVWSVQGGMHALAQSLARLAIKNGVTICYQSPCESIGIKDGRVTGVRLINGEHFPADSVIFNGDMSALGQCLLGESVSGAVKPLLAKQRSLSALTWSIHAPTSGFDLERHNVFFSLTMHRNSAIFFHVGGCRRHRRSMFARKTVALALTQAQASGCYAWSMRPPKVWANH